MVVVQAVHPGAPRARPHQQGATVSDIDSRPSCTVDDSRLRRAFERGETVDEAFDAFEGIADTVEETSHGIQEVGDVIDAQARTADEVVTLTEDVAAISEEVSGQTDGVADLAADQVESIEAVTDSAGELERMADDLRALTAEFGDDAAPGHRAADAQGDRPVAPVEQE